ncbi:CDP-glycerol glycerophosphotransferase [Candidatus Methylopumilus planktonicus]
MADYKSKVVVIIPSRIVKNTFLDSGSMDKLSAESDLIFFRSPDVDFFKNSKSIDLNLANNKTVSRFDIFFWYFYLFVHLRRVGVQPEKSFKAAQLNIFVFSLFRVISNPIFSWIIKIIDYFWSRNKIAHFALQRQSPDLVIAPASAMDTYSYYFIREAKALNIPCAMIVSHWDYFSKKGLRIIPDRLYVWGNDMYRTVLKTHIIPKKKVCIIGAPHFDRYISSPYFNSPIISKVDHKFTILFAGTSVPFDEESVLFKLDEYIETNKLNVSLIYKPHPRAWNRKSKVTHPYKHTKFFDGTDYDQLLLLADGLITPFSSMILEFALIGKPSLAIFINDNLNDWKFSEMKSEEHIKMLIEHNWLNVCKENDKLEGLFERFLEKLADLNYTRHIKLKVKNTVFYSKANSFSERLYEDLSVNFKI